MGCWWCCCGYCCCCCDCVDVVVERLLWLRLLRLRLLRLWWLRLLFGCGCGCCLVVVVVEFGCGCGWVLLLLAVVVVFVAGTHSAFVVRLVYACVCSCGWVRFFHVSIGERRRDQPSKHKVRVCVYAIVLHKSKQPKHSSTCTRRYTHRYTESWYVHTAHRPYTHAVAE